MNVQCPSCSTTFRVDPAKVPAGGVRARCSVCAAVFPVSVAPAASVSPPAPAPVRMRAASATAAPRTGAGSGSAGRDARARTGCHHAGRRHARCQAPSLVPPAIPGARPPQPRPAQTPLPQPVSPPRPAAGGRSVNPFLSQDPSLKARRLARALVSDMVVYHPAKRRDALKAGTVKESFKEEITKSWEEYVEQVGRELADSTPYFREALNEILGDGSQIF